MKEIRSHTHDARHLRTPPTFSGTVVLRSRNKIVEHITVWGQCNLSRAVLEFFESFVEKRKKSLNTAELRGIDYFTWRTMFSNTVTSSSTFELNAVMPITSRISD